MDREWLAAASENLERTVANILQIPQKDATSFANRVTRAVAVKAGGAATATGILTLVGTFGTASTGTAIASLSGAAYSTASLYWMGSLIGGGVVAGGVLTGGIGIVAAVLAMKLFGGKPRQVEALTEEEQRIVSAALGLAKTFREQIDINKPVLKTDGEIVCSNAWRPFLDSLKDYEDSRANETLNLKNQLGLINRRHTFDSLSRSLKFWLATPDTTVRDVEKMPVVSYEGASRSAYGGPMKTCDIRCVQCKTLFSATLQINNTRASCPDCGFPNNLSDLLRRTR